MTRSGPLAARERVAACLIVQNERERLPAALESVGFCDEIVVVDGGSTDGTVDVARAAGAKVIENAWPGFAAQRNVALDAATSDWVLELDADERVSAQLGSSIEDLLANPSPEVKIAVCARRNSFLGRPLGPSAKYPEYRSRLFRRDAYRHDESRGVHEGLEPRERPAILAGELEHMLAKTFGEALRDMWRYARLESRHIDRPSNPAAYLKGIVIRPGAKIVYRTLVDRGWRDGWRGLFKIALDASSDALVWALVLFGGTRGRAATGSDRLHFGRRPAGAPKIVALAARGASARRAQAWLSELQARGVDVTLVSDEDPHGEDGGAGDRDEEHRDGEVPTRRLSRLGPLTTMRALDVEMQVRTIHAVVPFGWRARLVWRLLPGTLRPRLPGVAAGTPAAAVVQIRV
jgi:glycosyl transferase family 2